MRLKPVNRLVGYAFAIAFVLLGWEVTALIIDSPVLPGPIATIGVFVSFAGDMLQDFLISAYRILISLVIGTIIAMPLGLAIGLSKFWDSLFSPVLYIMYPLPKIVLLPILLALLGLGNAPKIALISITIFFQVIVVMRDAAKSIPEQTLVSMKSLGASRWQLWRHVVIPATLPELFTTLRVSSGIAIAVLFFSEAIAGSTGLGYFIMESWAMVNYARMFAGIIALAILGVAIYEIFDLIEKKATRWRSSAKAA